LGNPWQRSNPNRQNHYLAKQSGTLDETSVFTRFWPRCFLESGLTLCSYSRKKCCLAVCCSHAHNGFVDLVLEVGLVGLIIFLLGFTGTIYRTFRMAYIKPAPQLLWACGYLSLLIIFNFSESLVMRKSSFFFVIYMAIYLSVLLPERELADDT
jgi:hypothetical protein